MRIIGGKVRGRRLYVPKSSAVRPTADRIKDACFNILRFMDGKTFLDLFSGTGNMGLEALSRGASRAVFIENDPVLIDAITRNIAACGFTAKGELMRADFVDAIQTLLMKSETFDILFADPPYEQGFVKRVLDHPGINALMVKDGLLAVQHSAREAIHIAESARFVLSDQRKYGDTVLSFMKKQDDQN